jgi:hypothetical protein
MVGYAHWAHTNNPILVTIMQRTILLTSTTIFAVWLSLGLTGCGGSSDSGESTVQEAARVGTTPTGAADACALLSAADIAGIVGKPVLGGQP